MFQNSALTVFTSESPSHTDPNRWGESTIVYEDTTSDNDEEDSDSGEEYEEYKEDPFYHKETQESTKETDPTIKTEDITFNAEEGARSTPEQDANQSSSVEPTWGTWRRQTPQEIKDDWTVWTEANIDKEKTTQAYRHGRCHLCDKPVSSSNMDERTMLTCWECKRTIIENEGQENEDGAGDKGKKDKDDEEEWGRIPIPQSDDSEDEPWLEESQSPDSEGENKTPTTSNKKGFSQNVLTIASNTLLVDRQSTEDFAFRNGPRKDGIIQRKDGSLITLDEDHYTDPSQPERALTRERAIPETGLAPPRWSPLLLTIQGRKLKMKYKAKTKVRAKLMRAIRKQVLKKEHSQWERTNGVTINKHKLKRLLSLVPVPSRLTQWDTAKGFMNQTYPMEKILVQGMNAIRSPNRNVEKVRRRIKINRSRPIYSPITIPGTPENQMHENKFEKDKQDEDLDLYYKIYAKHKPEFGESNAESVDRTEAIEAEYVLQRNLGKIQKGAKNINTSKHSLSPFQPIKPAPRFKSLRAPSPIIEPIVSNPTEDNPLTNYVQQVTIETDHGLYDNPDKPLKNEPIQVIYDTGASISMLPADYAAAWANLQ